MKKFWNLCWIISVIWIPLWEMRNPVCIMEMKAIRSLVTGEFSANDIYAKGQWMYPAAAFHGVEGEPC